MSALKDLERFGQSLWIDFLSRSFLDGGELPRLIAEDGLKGMTSNPSIFEKAISKGEEYDGDIKAMAEAGRGVDEIFRSLAVADIKKAADGLKPVYDATEGVDGYVSIEVSPYLAHDTEGTIAEARSLWAEIARPNIMIKVPATQEGLPAIATLISEAINVNITLLFAESVYEQVTEAYMSGLERRKGDISKIASVASFFVSRIDTLADEKIDAKLADKPDAKLAALKGKIAVANAKRAYQFYKSMIAGPRWKKLAARGARPQRLLWASTSTKNKAYSDVLYVETLIGPDTVNTMPPETMDAWRDHGKARASLEDGVAEAQAELKALAKAGISLDEITDELVVDGVAKFADAADKLYAALADKRAKILDGSLLRLSETLGENEKKVVDAAVADWTTGGKVRRLWAHDKSVWTNADEDRWLGWLDIAARERKDHRALSAFAQSVRTAGYKHVALFGMGGSSLGAEVIATCFGHLEGWPKFHALDSTDPDEVQALNAAIDLKTTLFIVCSKSGSTLEPNLFMDYFFARLAEAVGEDNAGKQFVAVTDPGSSLEAAARDRRFAHVFHGDKSIGGRYSVLSAFGLVPMAAMGLDTERLLAEAERAMTSCGASVPPRANPGVRLGVLLGALATQCGRDKVTILTAKPLASAGAWLEQLIAESTGKDGKALIPVADEPLSIEPVYGDDRVFVYLHLAGTEPPEEALAKLVSRGHPVIRVAIEDSYQLGQLFFVWEMAIAAAGNIMGIDPFDQPDVEASKVKARALTKKMEEGKPIAPEGAVWKDDDLVLYADPDTAAHLPRAGSLADCLKAFLAKSKPRDYIAILAYIQRNEAHAGVLRAMRVKLRDAEKLATCLGFGPRFQHSTGQAYKGGPNTGLFLEITADHGEEVPVPGRKIGFRAVQMAQAIGDFDVLVERKRRALRLHLKNTETGLALLAKAIDTAIG